MVVYTRFRIDKWAIDLQKMPIVAKKSSFQMKLILLMWTSKIVALGAQKTQNESLLGADFTPDA